MLRLDQMSSYIYNLNIFEVIGSLAIFVMFAYNSFRECLKGG